MEDPMEKKAKIRFKFRTGEEFEAEGNPDFIEKQRTEFLLLINKYSSAAKPAVPQPAVPPFRHAENGNSFSISQPQPAFSQAHAVHTETRPPFPTPSASETRLWEEIVKTAVPYVILRRKHRLLTPETAALLLMAAAKTLLNMTKGYSALHLAKSLSKSGYGGERLDRILASEMLQGRVKAYGSKRSRFYMLSDEGFAKAYVLAEKIASERGSLNGTY